VKQNGGATEKGHEKQMSQVTVTKLEWIKDEKGNFVYDEIAIAKFHKKAMKQMEKQNAKIAASPKLQRSFSICDPKEFADLQVSIYQHNFRKYNEVIISK
jgi:inosine-uridine nucleoside N-ribohydrolase